jgi:hypothetical protein
MNNILVRKNKTMMPYEEFYGKEASYTKSLRNFGEMCIRTVRKEHQDKLENQGDVCIFVAYLDNHYHDTYRLLNIKTKKIIESRDVRWTGKMYGTYKKKEENENEEESNEEREEDFGLSMAHYLILWSQNYSSRHGITKLNMKGTVGGKQFNKT